jgi:hypothetical protein
MTESYSLMGNKVVKTENTSSVWRGYLPFTHVLSFGYPSPSTSINSSSSTNIQLNHPITPTQSVAQKMAKGNSSTSSSQSNAKVGEITKGPGFS